MIPDLPNSNMLALHLPLSTSFHINVFILLAISLRTFVSYFNQRFVLTFSLSWYVSLLIEIVPCPLFPVFLDMFDCQMY